MPAILARPLFTVGRRPPAAITRTTSASSALPRLAGTLITPANKLAIFAGSPKGEVLQEGDSLDGMTVTRVAAGRITLRNAAQIRDLLVTPSAATRAVAVMAHVAERAPDGQHEE